MDRAVSGSSPAGPFGEVQALYAAAPRTLAFRARNLADALRWREQLSARLEEVLGVPRDTKPIRVEIVDRVVTADYQQDTILLRAETGPLPVYVLRPIGLGPFRPVLALHGHGHGVMDILGAERDGRADATSPDDHARFARTLVQRGFLVVAPEQLGFGSRRDSEDAAHGTTATSCRQASLDLLLLGYTMAGLRVRDIRRTLDYIAAHPDARPGPIGGVGFSAGGTALLYAAALDERLGALVLSGCLATYRQSIMALPHCEDNYLPGILRYAELPDIATVLAPRPLFVESGMDDELFPASSAVAAIAQLRKAYMLHGALDRLDSEIFAGGHRFHGVRAIEWLTRRL